MPLHVHVYMHDLYKTMKEKKFHLQNRQNQTKKTTTHFYISDIFINIYQIDSELFENEDNLKIDEMKTEIHVNV